MKILWKLFTYLAIFMNFMAGQISNADDKVDGWFRRGQAADVEDKTTDR